MPWVWSDELAERLDGHEAVVAASRLQRWRTAPTAYAVPAGDDLLGFALGLLGLGECEVGERQDDEASGHSQATG